MYVLYASPYGLLDTTNGAAASMSAVLRGVHAAGHRCEALTGSYSPGGLDQRDQRGRLAEVGGHKTTIGALPVVQVADEGVPHTVLDVDSQWGKHLPIQELLSFRLIEEKLSADQPDVILATGRVTTLSRLLPLVQARHIPLVFYLNTVKREVDPSLLGQVDRLIAPSVFLAQFYQERFGLDVSVLRPIVSPRLLVARQGARFVTMANPAPEKGLTLLYALAAEALARLPQARFLVVEGRWTACAATGIGIPLRELPNVTVLGSQRDVRQVYARTRVLLYPSYWEEAYGRTIAEAQLSGIPVIASRRGGIPEALNGAGFLLDVPPRCLADYHAIPTRAEMHPWLAILRALLTHPGDLRRASLHARHAAARGGSGTTCDAVALLAQAAAGR